MKLERLTLHTPSPLNAEFNDVNGRPVPVNGADDASKVPRLPRWTRQEILVLIQGKKVAENRIRRGRTGGLEFGSAQVEPKWASVSSYCTRHGVNRGPVQCRKRWSNLAGDYKKIKEWESQAKEETESFWVLRNDLRREKKLPGFFDREVYDILDRGNSSREEEVEEEEEEVGGLALALGSSSEILFDSGKSTVAEDDGLFSDFEPPVQQEPAPAEDAAAPATSVPVAPTPLSEQQYQPFSQGCPAQACASHPENDIREGKKRKWSDESGTDNEEGARNLQRELIRALERNGKMVSSQLEAQNVHFQQDREQRKDHGDCLVSVLNKLADALGRIADKL